MEELELEIEWRFNVEWCVLHDVGCWSIVKLRQGVELECEVVVSGGLHDGHGRGAEM